MKCKDIKDFVYYDMYLQEKDNESRNCMPVTVNIHYGVRRFPKSPSSLFYYDESISAKIVTTLHFRNSSISGTL